MQLVKGRRMKIHETHQIGTIEIDGNQYRHCKACGAVGSYTNALVMEDPCMGESPELKVTITFPSSMNRRLIASPVIGSQ
jgi:hypothetical protein